MDYTALNLLELKAEAKTRKIKQYYIMKRKQLIELLSMPELPPKFKIEKMTLKQLRTEASDKNLGPVWNLNREELVKLLFGNPDDITDTSPNKNEENDDKATKHNNPKEQNSK
jgi:hypothetical protein